MSNVSVQEDNTTEVEADSSAETINVSATQYDVASDGGINVTDASSIKETFRYIDFGKLVPDHARNPRRAERYTAAGPAGEKARSIHQHGLLEPLLVSERADGTVIILKGHLRHAGITLIRTTGLVAGTPKGSRPMIERNPNFMDKVKCRVMRGLTTTQELDLIMDHGSVTPIDKREAYGAMLTMLRAGFSRKVIAEKLGFKSLSPLAKLVQVANMPQCVADAYLADPKSDGYFSVTDEVINKCYSAYTADQKHPSARPKVGGREFNAAWESVVKEGGAARKKSLSATDAMKLATLETDLDLRELLEGVATNNSDLIAASLERLRIRLRPINDLSGFGHQVTEEGITRTVGE